MSFSWPGTTVSVTSGEEWVLPIRYSRRILRTSIWTYRQSNRRLMNWMHKIFDKGVVRTLSAIFHTMGKYSGEVWLLTITRNCNRQVFGVGQSLALCLMDERTTWKSLLRTESINSKRTIHLLQWDVVQIVHKSRWLLELFSANALLR